MANDHWYRVWALLKCCIVVSLIGVIEVLVKPALFATTWWVFLLLYLVSSVLCLFVSGAARVVHALWE